MREGRVAIEPGGTDSDEPSGSTGRIYSGLGTAGAWPGPGPGCAETRQQFGQGRNSAQGPQLETLSSWTLSSWDWAVVGSAIEAQATAGTWPQWAGLGCKLDRAPAGESTAVEAGCDWAAQQELGRYGTGLPLD